MATTVAGSGTMPSRQAPARQPLGVLGVLGLVLTGLGAFLLVSGVLLRYLFSGNLTTSPATK